MARGIEVRIDPGFEPAFLRSSDTRDLLQDLTNEALTHAKSSAAFRKGYLQGGVEAVVAFSPEARGYVGRVVSNDFKTVWLEYGTRRTRAQPFLVPALAAVVPGAAIRRR